MQLLESLRGRHRTMAANPVIRPGGKRAHTDTETTVLNQVKKKPAEPRSCLGELSDHCKTFCGPAEFAGSAHGVFGFMPARSHQGCSGLCPLDPINPNISTERAQGQLLSSWSKSGALHTNNPQYSLCAHPSKSIDSVSKNSLNLPWASRFYRNKRHRC
jgi:hypothetical protein